MELFGHQKRHKKQTFACFIATQVDRPVKFNKLFQVSCQHCLPLLLSIVMPQAGKFSNLFQTAMCSFALSYSVSNHLKESIIFGSCFSYIMCFGE